MVGQRHDVVVELEGVSVGDGNGKDGHVLVRHKAGVHFRQMQEGCWEEIMTLSKVIQCISHQIDSFPVTFALPRVMKQPTQHLSKIGKSLKSIFSFFFNCHYLFIYSLFIYLFPKI